MSEDKVVARQDHADMTYEAVVKAAWAADPDFVELCKTMYGPDASYTDVLNSERIAKFGAKAAKKAKKVKQVVTVVEQKHGKGKAFAAGLVVGAAAASDPHTRSTLEHHNAPYIYKMSPDSSAVHIPGTGKIERKKKPVLDNRQVLNRGVAKAREAQGLGRYQFKRDDHGRFASGAKVTADAAVAGAVGIGGGGYTGGKAVGHLNTLVNDLKANPRGRRALLHTLKTVGHHGGKAAALGGAAALMGTMGSHHGKQAYNELKDQGSLERQHRQDVRYATGELVMDQLEGKARNAQVVTHQGDKTAVTSIKAPGATKTRVKEFGKNAAVPVGKRAPVDMGGEISEVDEDKRQVFGWASITKIEGRPVVDLQGDYIDDDELERAAYEYVHKSRVGGAMHARVDEDGNIVKSAPYHAADLIESVVLTDDKVEKMGIQTDRTGWWVGFQVNDEDVWGKVKSGDWKGFSIHGSGRRTPTSLDELRIDDAELGT